MAGVYNGNSKRKYSWWWDSHISPKNSKWLQENLTDMDSNVKQMIKLIEEDADSFAKRAEMYYRQRPELMKLVEEFYRTYRALAERYDHATGVIRHAHKTMAEVFPNQVPLMFGEDSSAFASPNEVDPRTPEVPHPIRVPTEPDGLQKDASGFSPSHAISVKRNAAFTGESQLMSNRKGLKELSDLFGSETGGRARKGLNFNDHSDASKTEAEIVALKDALSKVQAEKEATLTQYKLNSEKLSNLESEVSRAQADTVGLQERATKAEAEVETLKGSLGKLEAEKVSSLLQYQQSLQKIADLENSISLSQENAGEINERASKAEAEAQTLKESLARAETDNKAALNQYLQCLETISNLEERLRKDEEDVRVIKERAEKAEAEVESLTQTISKLIKDKEAYELQYQQCLDTIADLKLKLFSAREETQRLSREIEDGAAKLKFTEEKCVGLEKSNQNLHSELDTLVEKLGNQSQELTEKQTEVGKLWTCVQEERLRFFEAETAFQTLQQLHSQSQEELNALVLELQTGTHILKDMEIRNNDLQEEIERAKNENKGLHELNLSSAASIASLQEEVSSLRETIQKLESEVEHRVDQRNALQQEIYCLKEELGQIGKKHQSMLYQVELVGLHPDHFGSSVKELQDESSKLKECNERERTEKVALQEKLEMMEKLVQKNLLLENSISDLNSELEAIRGKLLNLEEACRSLTEEKSNLIAEKDTLISRLQTATDNSEKLSEKNKLLENSLCDANSELEDLRLKLRSLEDSCCLLNNEKSSVISEREGLLSQMGLMKKSLEDLEKRQTELTMKVSALNTERESSLRKIEELGVSLEAKDQEYASFVKLSEAQLGEMESKIHHLQDENQCRERDYQEEIDRAVAAQIENFVLQKSLRDMFEKNSCLIVENQSIKEASNLSDKLVSELKHDKIGKEVQVDSLICRIQVLRVGLYQVVKRLEIIPVIDSENENSQDEKNVNCILRRLDEMQKLLLEREDENHHSATENFVLISLLRQLKSEAIGIATEKSVLEEQLESHRQLLSSSQDETQRLICMNEDLTSKVEQGINREEALNLEVEELHRRVLNLQDEHTVLQEENYKTLDEKRSLTKSTMQLEKEKCKLDEDVVLLLSDNIYQSNLILLLEDVILAKLSEVKKLSEDLGRLNPIMDKLEEKVKNLDTEKSELKSLLEKMEHEMISVRSANDQTCNEITGMKDQLCQKVKEINEAMVLISILQNERTELSKMVDDLGCKYKETKERQEEGEKQVLTLRGDYDEQIKETERANEVNRRLETRLQNVLEELEAIKVEREKLKHDLIEDRNEIELLESQAAALFGELQISAVHGVLLQGMNRELVEACRNLESRNTSKDVEIEVLRESVNSLTDTNKEQKADLSKYTQAAFLLDESVKSLENHIASGHEYEDETIKDIGSGANKDAKDGFSELYDMHLRIKSIEGAMIEKEKLAMFETTDAYSKLEAAMKEIKELKTRDPRSKRKQEGEGRPQKLSHAIRSEEIEVITKDIMLDQVSDCSSYGISRRGTLESNDQKLDLWEINEVKDKGQSLSEESLVVDKLEVSHRFTDPNQEVQKRKVLERLNSDLQKLASLQTAVQDLRSEVETKDKGKKGKEKGDEYETLKEQLGEADEEIGKLYDTNRKLMTKMETGVMGSDGNKERDLDETESTRRKTRRISEQARRGSEKIGRLQLEIQRIQGIWMKLEGERERRAKAKMEDSKARVLLRDYIIGGHRKDKNGNKKKKRSAFCACLQPQSP